MDKEIAAQILLDHYNQNLETDLNAHALGGGRYVIDEDETFATNYGWVFHVSFEKDGRRHILYGSKGVVVEKSDGSIHKLGSAFSLPTMLKEYEAIRKPSRLRWLIADLFMAFDHQVGAIWLHKRKSKQDTPITESDL
jgi:hypothetical protein